MATGRTFAYRGGVTIAGTVLTCDAPTGRDLVFLSSALADFGRGRRQVVTTFATLALAGARGARLRDHALVAPYGRPFALGALRLELFPSGTLPGSASLLAEVGARRVVYAGIVRPGTPGPGTAPMEVRTAEALCLDATFGAERFAFPPRPEALARVLAFASDARAAGRVAILLVPPFGAAMEIAEALAREGTPVHAHRSFIQTAARFRAAGASVPTMSRCSGKLPPGAVLLWPPDPGSRKAPILGSLRRPAFAFVSGWAGDPEIVARLEVESAIPLCAQADRAGLLEYVAASRAEEVALVGPGAEPLAALLRDRGLRAYALGPPRQTNLFTT